MSESQLKVPQKQAELNSILDSHSNYLARLDRINDRLSSLCDRLNGPSPCGVTDADKHETNGLLDKLRQLNVGYDEKLSSAEGLLTTVEDII